MTELWNPVRFGDLYAEPSRNGLTSPKDARGQGVPMVNMGELFSCDFIGVQEMRLAPLPPGNSDVWLLREGDLLFARRSLTIEGAGKCSLIRDLAGPTTFESSIIRVRLDGELADPTFFYYFFRSHVGRAAVRSITEQVAVAGIRSSDLRNLVVRVPPVAEQRRIAEALGALDHLAQDLERTCADVSLLQQVLFRQAWNRVSRRRIDEIGTIVMGQSPPGSTYNAEGLGLPFFQGVRDFGPRHPRARTYCSAPTRKAEAGDILLAVRAPIGDTNVPTTTVAIGRGLAALKATEPATALQALRLEPDLWSRFEGDGTVFAAVSKHDVASNTIPWPAEHIEADLAILDELYTACAEEALCANRIRDELLPLFMSGRARPDEVAA